MLFTAFGMISYLGEKLPPWVLTKGKTMRCEKKLGVHPDVIIHHSLSNWSTQNLIVEYIQCVYKAVAGGCSCMPVLDIYPSHHTERILQVEAENDVELLYVPAGETGRFHPMDCRIFGDLKACAHAEFVCRNFNMLNDIDYSESIDVSVRCWNAISTKISSMQTYSAIERSRNSFLK
jgi:hypothetical protein